MTLNGKVLLMFFFFKWLFFRNLHFLDAKT